MIRGILLKEPVSKIAGHAQREGARRKPTQKRSPAVGGMSVYFEEICNAGTVYLMHL